MRKEIIKSVFLTSLIVIAFLIGTFLPGTVADDTAPPTNLTDFEEYLIKGCSNSNVIEIRNNTFYCFEATTKK